MLSLTWAIHHITMYVMSVQYHASLPLDIIMESFELKNYCNTAIPQYCGSLLTPNKHP